MTYIGSETSTWKASVCGRRDAQTRGPVRASWATAGPEGLVAYQREPPHIRDVQAGAMHRKVAGGLVEGRVAAHEAVAVGELGGLAELAALLADRGVGVLARDLLGASARRVVRLRRAHQRDARLRLEARR